MAEHESTTLPSFVDALMADLRFLDAMVERAIERVRVSLAADADPAHRGLVIEESDVDTWLDSLGGTATGASEDATLGMRAARAVSMSGSRLSVLSDLFGLGALECAMLLTALAPEVDVAYANLYSYIQDDVTRKFATLDLVAALWCDDLASKLAARQLLGQGRVLRRNLLLHLDDSPLHHTSLLSRPLTLDARIAAFLLGSDDPDHTLGVSARVTHPNGLRTAHPLPSHQMERLVSMALRDGRRGTEHERVPDGNAALRNPHSAPGTVVWMRGPEKQGKRATAEHLAGAIERPLLIVEAPTLMLQGGDLRRLLYRMLREARLQNAVLFVAGADILLQRQEDGGYDLGGELARLISDWPGCVLIDIRAALPLRLATDALPIELDFPAPSNERRRVLWERALNGSTRLSPDVDLTLLTGAFRLTGEQIEAAADSARHAARWRAGADNGMADNVVTMRDLLAACRAHSNQGLGALSRKVTPRYTWDDLVLPSDRLLQLREMCLHVRYGPLVFEQWGFDRKLSGGKGLNMLFAGQPGTGKTMAAEVIATDLGLELYKIDLSTVVSKYIGETEKNLEKIFREGQTSNAILFFDEADSLFGKRSEVRDSHDRYANIEISYLLQKMEEYEGIVILATNLRKNLDDAFIRRLHGAIEFPMPEEPDRLEIWQRTFPPETPQGDDLDFGFVAKRFKLSGGNIKNIVLEAAFFAAEEGAPVSMRHLIRATKREHQKIGKLIHASDFGRYASMVGVEEAGHNNGQAG
jgi:SpoVK/Ycf46/Vps4 family AAA+-type ATPase